MSGPSTEATVSVVIGAYNAARWIRQTLESVLAQTYPVSEVIVVDDGSADGTPAIVKSFGQKVHLMTEQHRGRPHRNRGILASSSHLVAFVDADDCWHPAKLAQQVLRLHELNAAWVICDAQWLDSATGQLGSRVGASVQEGDILNALLLGNFIVASTPVVTRSVFDEVGLFDETSEVAPVEDWDLWLRIAARYPVACVRQRLVTLRLHADSFLAATPLSKRVKSMENVIGRAVRRDPQRLGPLRRAALFNAYHAAGVGSFRAQEYAAARGFFVKALCQRPAQPEDLGYLFLSFLGARLPGAVAGLRRKRALKK